MTTVLLALGLAGTAHAAGAASPAPDRAKPAHAVGAAKAASNPYDPVYQHPYRHGVVPTLGAKAKIDGYSAAHPAPAVSSTQLAYGAGFTGTAVNTGPEKVYLVFWGSQWGTAGSDGSGSTTLSGDTSGEAPVLQKLLKGLGTGGETWSGVATQYCEGITRGLQSCPANFPHAAYPTGGALAGVWVDESAAAPSSATSSQLGAEAVAGAAHFGNTTEAANANAQYVVLSPTGTHPDNFNTSSGNFCAWHSTTTSSYGDIAFHNEPYIPDIGGGCGQNYVNSGSAGLLDGVTITEGHEYAETVTDRMPEKGWVDSAGYEIADKCAWLGTGTPQGSANLSLPTGSFAMQALWSNDANSGAGDCVFTHPVVTGGPNLASNQPVTASSSASGYPASNTADGNTASYWESVSSAFPQTLTADVGIATEVGKVVLTLPPTWGARNETLSVSTSPDGTAYYTSVASATYTFDPATGNTVTIPVQDSWARYVRLNVTANTGWPAAQISEFRVFPPAPAATDSTSIHSSVGWLTFDPQTVGTTSPAQTITITNSGTSPVAIMSTVIIVTDFAQTNTCANSLGAGASCTISVTFTPGGSGTRFVSVILTTANSGSYQFGLNATGVDNLARYGTATAGSTNTTYVAGNPADGDATTYWQSADAFPQWATVDTRSAHTIIKLVLTLPPSFSARTETLSIDRSGDGTTFTPLLASASYTFDPSTGNSVTIPAPASGVRYVRLNVTANTAATAAQLSEFQIFGY
jgi:hypothetical protein